MDRVTGGWFRSFGRVPGGLPLRATPLDNEPVWTADSAFPAAGALLRNYLPVWSISLLFTTHHTPHLWVNNTSNYALLATDSPRTHGSACHTVEH